MDHAEFNDMRNELNERSKWLLRFLAERYPYGFSINQALPYVLNDGTDRPLGTGMRTFRGLERRGLVREGEHCLVYITEKGLELLQSIENTGVMVNGGMGCGGTNT